MPSTPGAPPSFWQVEITVPEVVVAPLEGALDEISVALLCFEVDEAHHIWKIQALCEDKPDPAFLAATLALVSTVAGIEEPSFEVIRLEGRDWLRENLITFPPISVGRFFVHGSHHKAKLPAGRWPLTVDAATAFGSGDHDSTRGCLTAINLLAKRHRYRNILDMGCGSGILSLAAARAFARPVRAVDIDVESVRVARFNAHLNGLAAFIRAEHGNGARGRTVIEGGPYDLILANILARPLCGLARPLAGLLAPKGKVVLAGLLDWQEAQVLSAYRSQGLRLVHRIAFRPWTTLILGR